MRPQSLIAVGGLLVFAIAAFSGCATETGPEPVPVDTPQTTTPAAATPEIKLAPPGQPTPPLDGGKLQATMPEGWRFLPRSNDYLFAAYFEDKAGVPRMVLTKAEAGDLPTTDSAEAAKQLVSKIIADLALGEEALITTVNVGDNWLVRYEKAMKFRSLPARSVTLETVQDGDRYKLELLTYTEDKEKFLPALYRFAASMEFAPSEPEETAPAAETENPQAESPMEAASDS